VIFDSEEIENRILCFFVFRPFVRAHAKRFYDVEVKTTVFWTCSKGSDASIAASVALTCGGGVLWSVASCSVSLDACSFSE
jgi:hypothetical protein